MRAQRSLLAAAVAIAATVGCSQPAVTGFNGRAGPPRIAVTVTNDHWLDVAVYAVRGPTRVRIGTVEALSTATFRLPSGAAPDGTVRLMADPIGSRATHVTDAIVIGSGQRIEFRIANRLSMSSFAVWNR